MNNWTKNKTLHFIETSFQEHRSLEGSLVSSSATPVRPSVFYQVLFIFKISRGAPRLYGRFGGDKNSQRDIVGT